MKPIEEYTREEKIEGIRRRLLERKAYWDAKIERNLRELTVPKNADSEDSRVWLDQFVVGEGLDICCGHYTIGGENSIGVDPSYNIMGNHFNFSGDALISMPVDSFDYVVCNYFDCFESPLKALNEWHRVLKAGGTVAFICSNADKYDKSINPLNGKRVFLYTPHIIELYMDKLKFRNVEVNTYKNWILVNGIK